MTRAKKLLPSELPLESRRHECHQIPAVVCDYPAMALTGTAAATVFVLVVVVVASWHPSLVSRATTLTHFRLRLHHLPHRS
jgi:hypothetical protein